MAILNETAILGPNYWMLVISIVAIVAAGTLFFSIIASDSCPNPAIIIFAILVIPIMFVMGIFGIVEYNEPDFAIPTNKKYIEATFAKGSPTAAILEKYDVIGREGKVWYLVTKDGVKDEKRPTVTIYEEEAE